MPENEENNLEETNGENGNGHVEDLPKMVHLAGMYRNWFLDYASYVILERAVPYIEDGLKPVQRRILHSMKEIEDGRFNKVANIIGNTMKYHPHGDVSIGDALVQLGQKDLLIDTQGNWGNILTGDKAAASRYIEARLSKFALDVVFNPKTTNWQSSYDGRNKEPVTLPVKFPLLLAQGIEGIAVGLACKILPHNFNELIDGSIAVLKGKITNILPDFSTGGMADFSQYNNGLRGGKIRIRAKISQLDKKTLVITEIPYGTTTSYLIESVVKANDRGKIKIKKIEDNTSENVEIFIHLSSGISPDKTIDALYAFTDCEISISPNTCVIENDKPRFIGVNEILEISAKKTLDLLKQELEIKQGELEDQWHFVSLEKIFIEKRIYRDIEECRTWEAVIKAIRLGLIPHLKKLKHEVTDEDIVRLTEIRIKRISKYNSLKADEHIKKLEEDLSEVQLHLDNIVDYAIDYFKGLKKKYGKGRERKTEMKSFDTIVAAKVATANVKLYVNRDEGFAGYGMKKDEFVCDCSDIDDIIIFRKDGIMMVSRISEKAFMGKDIVHIGVWKKGDERTIYNMIYQNGLRGNVMMKRFPVSGITRDKEYDLTKGAKGSKILYFTSNPNGEAEVVTVFLKPKPKLKKLKFDLNFSDLTIKGRGAAGKILTKHRLSKIVQKEQGISTLGARKIWFDDTIQRLNADERGEYLGEFSGDDKILTIMQSGNYQLCSYDLTAHFEEDMILIEKCDIDKPVSATYFDGEKQQYFVKRFLIPSLSGNGRRSGEKNRFITEHQDSFLEFAVTDKIPMIEISFVKGKNKQRPNEKVNLAEFITVKGFKAKGKRLSTYIIKDINLLPPLEVEETEQTAHAGEALPADLSGTAGQEDKNVVAKEDMHSTKTLPAIPAEVELVANTHHLPKKYSYNERKKEELENSAETTDLLNTYLSKTKSGGRKAKRTKPGKSANPIHVKPEKEIAQIKLDF
ncbi:MAG: DNA gyrase/topoisomerase IV subunit A [Bacteroidota bacterium]